MLRGANPCGGFVDSKHWATPLLLSCLRGEGRGRSGAKRTGNGGLGDVGLGTLGGRGVMGRDSVTAAARRVGAGGVGGGQDRMVRRGTGRGGLTGRGGPGLHKARHRRRAGEAPI